MKTIITAAIVLTIILAIPALAITNEEAQTIAQNHVPFGAVHQRTEIDDGMYETKYLSEDGTEEYEVTIDRNSGEIILFEQDLINGRGGKEIILTEDEARTAVLNLYPRATIHSLRSELDDGLYEYKIEFSTDSFSGSIDLNTESGAVLEADLFYTAEARDILAAKQAEKQPAPSVQPKAQTSPQSGELTKDEAIAKIGEFKPGAKVNYIKRDKDDGRIVYEGKAALNGQIYEFEIDATSGKLREWDRDD